MSEIAGMGYEIVVAAFDRADRADAAVAALRRAGVPRRDIRRHPVAEAGAGEVAEIPERVSGVAGILAWLLGEDAVAGRVAAYRRALGRGGTILSVRVLEDEAVRIRATLERYGPIDVAEGDGDESGERPAG